jgi:NAD(P)-dependent dehydrogenase (short-subunit alcohol dehydrogenase family)
LVREIQQAGNVASAFGCDATDERSVERLMNWTETQVGVPHLVVYAVQGSGPGDVVDVEVAALEESWRQNCLGGFIVAREAARCMAPIGRGSIVLVGSTSSLIGRAGHLSLAVGKFGLRAVAQVLSREVWRRGIHVAHLVIDADIKEDCADPAADPQSDPYHIAELLYQVHCQKKSAWTSELDVRPWNERFWEHC